MRSIFPALLIAVLAACGPQTHDHDDHDHGNATTGRSTTSDNGDFTVSYVPSPDPMVVGQNEVEVTLLDADGQPATGFDVKVVLTMPSHGHGTSADPHTEELGEGRYRVTNVVPTMPGKWVITVHITKEAPHVHDHASFLVTLE